MIPRPARPGTSRSEPALDWWRASRAAFTGGLGRPSLWPFALLGFLLRGGWFLFLAPVVVFPSTVGVSTFIGPLAVTPAGPSSGFLQSVTAAMAALAVWVVVGGLIGAVCEATVIVGSIPAHARDRGGASTLGAGTAVRILSARLMSTIPLIVAIAWAVPRTVGATYAELITPVDPAVPLPIRVLRDLPDVIGILLVSWLVAEVVGALAARRIVLFSDGPLGAVVLGVGHVVRRPVSSIGTTVVTLAGSIVMIGPALVLAGVAWARSGTALSAGDAPAEALLSSFLFVLLWGAGLVLAAAASSWRSIAWTLEVVRLDRRMPSVGAPAALAPGRLVESEGTSAAT